MVVVMSLPVGITAAAGERELVTLVVSWVVVPLSDVVTTGARLRREYARISCIREYEFD